MNTVSLISAIVAVAGALSTAALGALFEHRRQRGQREQERQHLASQYSHPLLRAASALHARVGWFMKRTKGDTVPRTLRKTDQRSIDYTRYETLFRLANYLGWVEIMLQEVYFLDLGSRKRNHKLAVLLARVHDALSRDDDTTTPLFRLRGGEQRAIGELMIEPDKRDDARPRCLGYVAFRSRLDSDSDFAGWFAPLLADIDKTINNPHEARARVGNLHATLSALIDFLDPHQVLLPFSHEKLD